MAKKEITIFKGKSKPQKSFVGVETKTMITEDKFGELWEGNVRSCYINTRWGQLSVPYLWIGKKIQIKVKELKNEHK